VTSRSWIDAFAAAVGRLPGPPWLAYVALILITGGGSIVLRVLDGSVAFLPISPVTTAFAAFTVLPFAVMHYLSAAARRSLEEFRPALGDLEARYSSFERRLTTMHPVAAVLALVPGAAVLVAGQVTSNGGWGITEHTSLATNVFTIACQFILNVGFAAFVFRAVAQLRVITELHREATGIRLWQRGPHVAFARFTFVMAVSLTVPYALVEVLATALDEGSTVETIIFVLAIAISVLLFALPLTGMRRQLVRVKARQLEASDRAFESAAARLHATAESGRLEDAGAINDLLGALVVEHERLKKISAWPWSVETLRGFLSSIGLPILLWLVTAALDRYLSF
jgi:hypothetical protein